VVFHQGSAALHDDLETTTDEEGRFRFDGIDLDPTLTYGVTVTYQGALYGIDLDLSARSRPPVSLVVYDAVDTEDVLSASSASILFADVDQSTRTVSALEIVTIVNSSDHTYVPGSEPMKLLRFGLPANSKRLIVDTKLPGADFVQVDRGFALLASVPPGEHEVMYAYEFPYSGTEVGFTKKYNYGAGQLRVLAPHGELKLSGGQLGAAQTVTIGERSYQLIEAVDLPRGTLISLELEELPQPSLIDRLGHRLDRVRFEYVGPVGLGLVMTSLIGFAVWRRAGGRRRGAAETPEASPAAGDERRTIIALLADLHGSLEAGTLTDREYRRRYRVLSARLTTLSGN
jgi:hypothetical protein